MKLGEQIWYFLVVRTYKVFIENQLLIIDFQGLFILIIFKEANRIFVFLRLIELDVVESFRLSFFFFWNAKPW